MKTCIKTKCFPCKTLGDSLLNVMMEPYMIANSYFTYTIATLSIAVPVVLVLVVLVHSVL